MTEQEVIEKIKYMQKYQTETDQLEAKTAEIDFQKKCYDTISAFANKCGGIIIFGLNENNNFIRRNISTKVVIDENGNREDIPEYPMKALREAIANALVHRDYSISRESAYIYVQIYKNRIEIINPGDLYGNNRLEELGTDVMLESRNKNIVKLLEINGNIIENRHTGIATMIDEMIKMNLPAPKFESLRGDFKVTFWKELDEEDRTEQNNSGQKWTEVNR